MDVDTNLHKDKSTKSPWPEEDPERLTGCGGRASHPRHFPFGELGNSSESDIM